MSWRAVLLVGALGFISSLLSNCFVVRLSYLEDMRRRLERLEEAAR